MPNYEEGKVYCIRSHATVGCYVGSTTQPLSKRFYHHKREYNKWIANNNLKYYTSFKVLEHGIDDCYIELIENVRCNDKNELERREGEIMRITDNCVNQIIAGRTPKEYRNDNKLYLKEVSKERNKNNYIKNKLKNAEYYRQKAKKWNEDNNEKIKEKYKQSQLNNPEIKKERDRKYREKKKAEKVQ
jgi:hypothetical protein